MSKLPYFAARAGRGSNTRDSRSPSWAGALPSSVFNTRPSAPVSSSVTIVPRALVMTSLKSDAPALLDPTLPSSDQFPAAANGYCAPRKLARLSRAGLPGTLCPQKDPTARHCRVS